MGPASYHNCKRDLHEQSGAAKMGALHSYMSEMNITPLIICWIVGTCKHHIKPVAVNGDMS